MLKMFLKEIIAPPQNASSNQILLDKIFDLRWKVKNKHREHPLITHAKGLIFEAINFMPHIEILW